jgi:hypothetical protein
MTTQEIMIHAGALCLFGAAVIACFMPKINNEGRRK